MTLELVPLCRATVTPAPPVDLGVTPAGHRVMVAIQDSIWEGERLRARKKPDTVAADWLVIAPDGTGLIDVRLTLETDDGADIYVSYSGRRDFTKVEQGIDAPVYIALCFETSDPRYAWLNGMQAIGKGTAEDQSRIYEIFELR